RRIIAHGASPVPCPSTFAQTVPPPALRRLPIPVADRRPDHDLPGLRRPLLRAQGELQLPGRCGRATQLGGLRRRLSPRRLLVVRLRARRCFALPRLPRLLALCEEPGAVHVEGRPLPFREERPHLVEEVLRIPDQ